MASCSLTFTACYVIKHKTVGVISCLHGDSLGLVMKLGSFVKCAAGVAPAYPDPGSVVFPGWMSGSSNPDLKSVEDLK